MPNRSRLSAGARGYLASLTILLASLSTAAYAFDVVLVDSIGATLEASPGSVLERSVRVANATTEERFVQLRAQSAALVAGDRAADIAAQHSSVDWFDLPGEPVAVPAGATISIPYQLRVPDSAEGSFWAELLVQPVTAVDLDPMQLTDDADIAFEIVVAYSGIVFTDVVNTGTVRLELLTPSIVRANGEAFELHWGMENSGNRIASVDASWEVIDVATGEVIAEALQRHTAFPGGRIERREALPDRLAPGTYEVIVLADAARWSVTLTQETIEIR